MPNASLSRTFALSVFLLSANVSYSASLPNDFSSPPGDLEPNSGTGRHDATVYFPNMRFPLEHGPAYLNSQVYRPGGDHGGSGDQCDQANYSYPWRDNFCEERQWAVKFCPAGKGHQGQDIRPSTCKKDTYWAVAVEDGIIANVGTYSVTLQAANGVLYRYLHLNMDDLTVQELDRVSKGAKIGKVSNYFGSTTTTIHLHFDVKGTVLVGDTKVVSYLPPYTSLIASYKKLMGQQP